MANHRPARSILRVAGDDAGAFLDALLTNDVSAATPGRPVYAALLSPQGKVFADMFAHRADDGALLLDVALDRAAELHRRLVLYRLRRKIDIEDVSSAFGVEIRLNGAGPPDPRLPGLGARLIVPAPTIRPDAEAQRIGAGIPDPTIDAGIEEVFALEALLEELHGVDFQKGCFIGQENVSRMKRRATTRRKFCRIAFDGPPPPYGAPVTAGEVMLGEVRSGVPGAAIALLRLDRALTATEGLVADNRPVRLDPPDWLILPLQGDD